MDFKSEPIPAPKEKTANALTPAAEKHLPMVQAMIKEQTSRSTVMPYESDEHKFLVDRLIADVQRAGRHAGATIRKEVKPLSGKDAGKVAVKFWPRPAIKKTGRDL